MKPIRLGSSYGGRYVVTDILDKNSVVYSVGIGCDISFDLELHNLVKCRIYMMDGSPKSVSWMAKQTHLGPDFLFFPYCLLDYDGTAFFEPPVNPQHVSYNITEKDSCIAEPLPVKCLSSVMSKLNHHHIDFLKLDIEGSEYRVLFQMLGQNIFPTQIACEFHGSLHSQGATLDNLKSCGYKIVATDGRDITLLRQGIDCEIIKG